MRTYLALVSMLVACGDDPAPADTVDVPDASETTPETTPETVEADTAEPDTAEPEDTVEPDTQPEVDTAEPDTTEEVDTAPPAPPNVYLTIAAIPPEMNGSRAAITPDGELPFKLRVNRSYVALDVLPLPDSGPFELADLAVSCTADGAPHDLPAPTEVAPNHLQVLVDEAHAFPHTPDILCTATISNAFGTSTSSLAFGAVALTPELDPFPTTDVWYVLTTRDVWTLEVTDNGDGTRELRSRYAPDGVDDFVAPLYEIGFMPPSDPEATAAIRAHLLQRVRQIVNGIYGLDALGAPTPDGVDLHLYFEGDEGAPDPATFGATRFSMIALTGDGDRADQEGTTFGRALIDWNNQRAEDDTVKGLGVWPAAIVRGIMRNPISGLVLPQIQPSLGGIPFGLAEGDELFIGRDVDPSTLPEIAYARADLYSLLIRFGSLAIASILAHEIGHSLGLVPYGPPPFGLFAGEDVDWVVTVAPDAHIDTAGLNVMQTGGNLNITEALAGELPRFEPLSWAYLRRMLVVGPN